MSTTGSQPAADEAPRQSLVDHGDVARFADERVNLKREDVKENRERVNRLRDKLEKHIKENPDVGLVKMLLSGSLAKGTALRDLNDIDVAVYVSADKAPAVEAALLDWLAERLRTAYPQMDPNQISPGKHCVRISFRGSGLDVDVVPVRYEGDPDDRGYLFSFSGDSGEALMTSIPLHLKFIQRRKKAQPTHFAQVVRLVKWWVKQRKKDSEPFRLKSFMVEMLIAHLADAGADLSDYPTALEQVFAYLVKSRLKTRIAFTDYYPTSRLPGPTGKPIEVFDPVNEVNNVAADYIDQDRQRLVDAAEETLDALSYARYATSRAEAIACWQTVLGPSFRGLS